MAKRERRLVGVDDLMISLAAKGLSTGEFANDRAGFKAESLGRSAPGRDRRPRRPPWLR